MRRFAAGACVAVAVFTTFAPAAAAHAGQRSTVVTSGPYRLVIVAGPVASGSRAALAFSTTVTDRSGGAPVRAASLRLVVRTASGSPLGAYSAPGFGGVYSLLVPIPSPNTWRSLRFGIRIRGPLGTFSALYRPPSLLGEWSVDPFVLASAVLGAAFFLHGFVRLRRRGRADHASYWRVVLFTLGLCLVVAPLVSPLDAVADRYLLSAHMLEHVLLGDAAPAVLLLALRGPLLFFVPPRRLVRALGRSRAVRRFAAWLLRPRVALGAWGLAFWGWHVPVAYDFAATHQVAHDVEHASFLVSGLLVWSLLIDPSGQGHLSRGRRLGVAAAVFAMGTVVSDLLIFSLRPLYPVYADQVERVFSFTPLRDQQLAGLVMTIEQTLSLGTFALILLLPALGIGRHRGKLLARRERLA
jgi:cytochrome c oxidase assembly factor CtaG